jgi:hypothetical protein
VKKRQILDNIILVQEALHSSKTWGEKGMIIKLNMANAFDRVRHSFLLEVVKTFGFQENFLRWLYACIASPWIVPLVNGSPISFFLVSRGLRQACPLSPILYIIMVEDLNSPLNMKGKEKKYRASKSS